VLPACTLWLLKCDWCRCARVTTKLPPGDRLPERSGVRDALRRAVPVGRGGGSARREEPLEPSGSHHGVARRWVRGFIWQLD